MTVILLINVTFFSSEIGNNFVNSEIEMNIFNYACRMVIPPTDSETLAVAKALYFMPNLLFIVVLWIPIYLAITTLSYIVVLINEFSRNIILTTLIIICFYFFLNPLFSLVDLEIFEPVIFGTFVAKGLIAMQYLFVPAIVNLVIILL